VKRSMARELPWPEFLRSAIRSSKQIRWSQGGTDLGICYACASPVSASRAARSGPVVIGTRSVKNVFHARSGISILSVRASCLTLQDRCFAVCDIQHRRTRAGSRGGGSSPGSCVPPRPGISTTNGKAIERQWMLAARSPSPDGRRLEHHAHALELVQAVRVLRGELTPRLRPQSRRNCPRAGEHTTPMYPRTSASG